MRILYDRNNNTYGSVLGYVDLDIAGDLERIKSLTGYVSTFASGANNWNTILQSTTVLSTTKAECMTIIEAMKEANWLRGLVGDLGLQRKLTIMLCDCQSAIDLTNYPKYHVNQIH